MGDLEVPNWLKELPFAPEFRPTDTEFADPIAYISKIEKEASAFGICKVIPPLPKPSKRFVFGNLNESLAKSPELVGSTGKNGQSDGEFRAVFTTRHQELGHSGKRSRGLSSDRQSGVHKQVWQSGEVYTLDQFESKAKAFARSQLSMIKDVNPLVIETLFWKAALEKAIYIEYANDVPGSGFQEPEDPFQYFHSRRRKRKFDKKCQLSDNCGNAEMDSMTKSLDTEDVVLKNDSECSLETCKQSSRSSDLMSDEKSRFLRSTNAGSSRESAAGWKLSNSPWNLQVISRSPGSLTRFMLDDIPGVTSPMVYIGMLFSWFAWHVEDHELHSLNFLHTGSQKTWYAVPGDYAFDFEEVIRSKGYEGNLDRLAALALLGEKTNLLSPEVVVASGIPCCRLVQNPGEYVVTFPRAYHVGFSHGFNCGEAANFGTSQWLKVAKEAAVRRAAMSYLPMLSHQQLLYMLTMSFVSRVPVALIPGARSSRLRDRQKDERELLVKKAFIDDMMNENNLLLALLAKDLTFRAVLWDPESLTSPGKDCQSPSTANVDSPVSLVGNNNIRICSSEERISSVENVQNNLSDASTMSNAGSLIESNLGNSCSSHNDRTRRYKGKLEDFYMEYDDLPCGLHVDSGTLACIACGILGFPFMVVVQPSEKASEELFPVDHQGQKEHLGSMKPPELSSPDVAVVNSASDPCNGPSQIAKDLPKQQSASKIDEISHKWNTSNRFLRPRIFCLEHALEIEDLLRSKGGANMLIICHSAYPKIKAHALAVAEEICVNFHYKEVPLEHAPREDLSLVDISIDDEENEECVEDWTTRLGINLQNHARLRKLSPLKQEQNLLALAGLFSGIISESNAPNLKWVPRRTRTPIRYTPTQSKASEPAKIEKDILPIKTSERSKSNGVSKIVQYSRRISRHERVSQSQEGSNPFDHSRKNQDTEISAVKHCIESGISRDALCGVENVDSCVELTPSAPANHEALQEGQTTGEAEELCMVPEQSKLAASLVFEKTENDLELNQSAGRENSDVKPQVSTIAWETSKVSCQTSSTTPASVVGVMHDSTESKNVDDVGKHETRQICENEERLTNVSIVGEFMNIDEVSFQANSSAEAVMVDIKDDSTWLTFIEKQESDSKICTSEEATVISVASDQANFPAPPSTPRPDVNLTETQTQNDVVKHDELKETGCDIDMGEVSEMISEARPTENPNDATDCAGSVTAATSFAQSSETQIVQGFEESDICPDRAQDASNIEQETQMKAVFETTAFSSGNLIDQQSEVLTADATNMEIDVGSELDVTVLGGGNSTIIDCEPAKHGRNKRKRKIDRLAEDQNNFNGFIRSPCEGLRSRNARIPASVAANEINEDVEVKTKKPKRQAISSSSQKEKKDKTTSMIHRCGIEGCQMRFETKAELLKHKRNQCTHDDCGKRFRSHRYTILHLRVHADDRPLKCPWKGCKMTFKWAWARTEHLRVHTGERPYQCKFEGCDLTFRFVSDYSRHRRRTGHYVD
ncbi:hypothetical protein Syun_000880 [Stephania yunnanensis]|uniref:Lysine-specific demethylase ELF6 n=1 Tax=Stephania yunnanensis TaxID=152371 RepID=A0AAP0LDS8_9MAGN